MNKAWGIAIPGLLLVGAAVLRVADPAPIENVRNLTFDNFQRLAPRPFNPDLPVRIADIDEKSLNKFGQWPWSRTVLAKMVDRLQELGAAVIAFDVLLSEPDRTAPKAIAASLPDDPNFVDVKARMAALPDPDAQLADAMKKVPTVLGFALLGYDPHRPEQKPQPIGGFTFLGDNPLYFVPSFDHVVNSLPDLRAVAAGNGAVNANPDSDGVVRRVPLLWNFRGNDQDPLESTDGLLPTLGLEALRIAFQAGGYTVRSSGAVAEGGASSRVLNGIGAIRLEGTQLVIRPNRAGELLLHDAGHQPGRYISIADLFDPAFPRSEVEGRIILVGTSVEGLKDIQTSPVASNIPGVELHAEVLEQILDTALAGATPLERPFWSDAAEVAYLVCFGMLVIGSAYRAGALLGIAVTLIAVIAAFGGSWWAFRNQGWLVDPLYPAATAIVLVMAATTVNFIRTEREKRFIRGAMSRFVSPEIVEQVALNPELLKLGGQNREVTVMFTDIRGFTKLSEGLDPQALTHVINAFLTPMSNLILGNRGTIDKFIGDCIMAFWNAPLDVPHHAREAVRTGVEMRRTLKRLNEQLATEAQASGTPPVKIRAGVGLNTGIGCVGNMGTEQRLAYSVLGDTVNTAARLESLSPAYFVDLVLGEETAADCTDFALLELDQVKVKGKAIPIRIFTCLGTEQMASTNSFLQLKPAHDRMLAAYRCQDWAGAEAARQSCLEIAPERLRGFYALYETRIAEFRADPPGADWDGVYVAKSKAG
jgi:adenylate cyclase